MCDEPFGPLALFNPVRSLNEAIEKANSLPTDLPRTRSPEAMAIALALWHSDDRTT